MCTKQFLSKVCFLFILLSAPAFAGEKDANPVYHAFLAEAGLGTTDDNVDFVSWHFDGWIGTDENKLLLKSIAKREEQVTEQAELWALYSRNIGTFWDAQIGIRHDMQIEPLTYGVVGFEGLAPYFFETHAYVFISEDGDFSARIKMENEFLVTQKLVTQPYVEVNAFAQDVPALKAGAGLSSAELGIQTRYEFARSFAPYIDLKYERKLGNTASIAKSQGKDKDAFVGTLGVRFLF